jgi:hypothetical protein
VGVDSFGIKARKKEFVFSPILKDRWENQSILFGSDLMMSQKQ